MVLPLSGPSRCAQLNFDSYPLLHWQANRPTPANVASTLNVPVTFINIQLTPGPIAGSNNTEANPTPFPINGGQFVVSSGLHNETCTFFRDNCQMAYAHERLQTTYHCAYRQPPCASIISLWLLRTTSLTSPVPSMRVSLPTSRPQFMMRPTRTSR